VNFLTPLQWHVFFVLVSSAALLVGFVFETKPFFESARPKPAAMVARWFLWVGAMALWGAVFSGFLQPPKSVFFHEVTGPSVEHRFLGVWTAVVFLAIAVWRGVIGRRPSALLVLVWLSAFWILGAQILGGFRLAWN
jgi:hypothetical protein